MRQQLRKLHMKASSFDPPMHETLTSFLAIITSCLEVNEDKRPLAETLAKQLKELYTRLDKAIPSFAETLLAY